MKRERASRYIIGFVDYLLRRYSSASSVVLDVGCGRGQYAQSIIGHYIGLDITSEPYDQHSTRRVDLLASANSIPIKDGSIDLVFTVGSFYQLPKYKEALHEFHRILRPGGRVILFDYNRRTQQSLVVREGMQRPCWTQVELRNLLTSQGFNQATLHLPLRFYIPSWITRLFIPLQERYGLWAVATGVK